MSNLAKLLSALACVCLSIAIYAYTTDAPGTANYVQAPIDNTKLASIAMVIGLVMGAICFISSMNISGSDDDEDA